MKNKLIITLIAALSILGFAGCDLGKAAEDTKNQIEDTADKATDKVKDATEKATDKIENASDKASEKIKDANDKITNDFSDEMMNLDEDHMIKKFEEKGFKVSKVEATNEANKSYKFSVVPKEILINNEKVYVYEYSNKQDLDKDTATIENNSFMVDGSKINSTTPPHIYRSGKLMLIYEGSNADVLKAFQEIFGTAIR